MSRHTCISYFPWKKRKYKYIQESTPEQQSQEGQPLALRIRHNFETFKKNVLFLFSSPSQTQVWKSYSTTLQFLNRLSSWICQLFSRLTNLKHFYSRFNHQCCRLLLLIVFSLVQFEENPACAWLARFKWTKANDDASGPQNHGAHANRPAQVSECGRSKVWLWL